MSVPVCLYLPRLCYLWPLLLSLRFLPWSKTLIRLLTYSQFYIYPNIQGNFDTLIGIPNPWKDSVERESALLQTYILSGVFALSAIMLLLSIIQTIRTPPGGIPDDKEWDMQSDSMLESSSDDESVV